MKVDIVMPKMGESINEGTLIKWHKKKGDKVKKDEIIYEISTDKVDTEIPSPEDGVLVDIKVFEQETVEVGTVVAVIDTNGEAVSVQTGEKKDDVPSTTQVGGDLIDVPMPKMGESVMEGTIIKWHKNMGDPVKRDEIIFEISTDKVDTEVPSPVDGTLSEILFKENDTVPVGIAVAKILTSTGISKPKEVKNGQDHEKDHDQEKIEKVKPVSKVLHSQQTQITNYQSPGTNRFYSPLVLNIARTEGISMSELEMIQGTGIGGRVSKLDVINYLQNKRSGKISETIFKAEQIKPAIEEKSEQLSFEKGERVKIIPMDNIRQRIMYHMVNSRDTSVHVTAMIEIDMSRIHNFIEKYRNEFLQKEGLKLTYMAFITYAAIKGLKEFPLMNASIDGNNIVVKNYINLGIAVAVEPNGLIVPNIKNADEKNIRGLARAIADLGNRSRSKKLVPDDVMDGTFSITNYGVFGSLFGTPIINQPEVGILGIGAVTKKPVVVENNGIESIAIKPMMYLSLSHDHRLVDGMLGGKFLKLVKDTLESFDTSIV
ncbi:MAG: 2-oxoglutarate dehydrogenase, E2 component, dihydrolipoamide succinyltransferase [Melioribacteraceae bacterium]|nr:2-oxoglutarate dehydrogenase, E2 component, dihydrolipoamide succinyltransferase [Melioribacteraceae bacterium]